MQRIENSSLLLYYSMQSNMVQCIFLPCCTLHFSSMYDVWCEEEGRHCKLKQFKQKNFDGTNAEFTVYNAILG